MIRTILAFLIAGLIGSGAVNLLFPPTPRVDSPLQDTVDAMSALTGSQQIPENFMADEPLKLGGEFDPNQYFTVLTHLQMEPGYTLDYVYYYDFMGGYPTLYARPLDQAPYQTVSGGSDDLPSDFYLNHVQADGTPESYFELAVLDIMGQQFYLHWHANYNDTQIIADSDGLARLLDGEFLGSALPADVRSQARQLDVQPVIEIGEKTVTVSFITFTNWGGFYRATYTMQRDFPHTILDVEWEELVPYDCGIMF